MKKKKSRRLEVFYLHVGDLEGMPVIRALGTLAAKWEKSPASCLPCRGEERKGLPTLWHKQEKW